MEKQLKIIEDLEEAVNSFIADFESSLPGANKELFEELSDFASSLKKGTTLRQRVENLRAIDKYRATLDKVIQSSEYSSSVRKFTSSFKESTLYVNDYFGSLSVGFENNQALYKEILQSNIQTTTESLLGSGFDANLKEPLIKILKDNVITGSDTKETRKALSEFLSNEGRSTRYVKQQANDSIRQFNRNYTKAITADLDLKHFYFKGTKIDTTRPWCNERAGKYFTKEEVESWPSKDWAGKIKGTNKQTIFIYVGGHACKHDLLPVSEALYNRAMKSA